MEKGNNGEQLQTAPGLGEEQLQTALGLGAKVDVLSSKLCGPRAQVRL